MASSWWEKRYFRVRWRVSIISPFITHVSIEFMFSRSPARLFPKQICVSTKIVFLSWPETFQNQIIIDSYVLIIRNLLILSFPRYFGNRMTVNNSHLNKGLLLTNALLVIVWWIFHIISSKFCYCDKYSHRKQFMCNGVQDDDWEVI